MTTFPILKSMGAAFVFASSVSMAADETIIMGGATTVKPIVEKVSGVFCAAKPGVKFVVGSGGSSNGIQGTAEGKYSIGMSSRAMYPEEKAKYPDVVPVDIGYDGVAVIVNKDNPLNSITKAQLFDIFTGAVKNWKEIGGNDAPIIPIGELPDRATISLFMEYVGLQAALKGEGAGATVRFTKKGDPDGAGVDAPAPDSIQKMIAMVVPKPNAICFVSVATVAGLIGKGAKLKMLTLEGVEPTIENVKKGSYPILRNLLLLTKGQPAGTVKDFIGFMLSADGQGIVGEMGFIPAKSK